MPHPMTQRAAARREALHALAWAAHGRGEPAPSSASYMAALGVDVSTVGAYVRQLKAAGRYPAFPPPARRPGYAPPAPVPTPAEIGERAALIRREWADRGGSEHGDEPRGPASHRSGRVVFRRRGVRAPLPTGRY